MAAKPAISPAFGPATKPAIKKKPKLKYEDSVSVQQAKTVEPLLQAMGVDTDYLYGKLWETDTGKSMVTGRWDPLAGIAEIAEAPQTESQKKAQIAYNYFSAATSLVSMCRHMFDDYGYAISEKTLRFLMKEGKKQELPELVEATKFARWVMEQRDIGATEKAQLNQLGRTIYGDKTWLYAFNYAQKMTKGKSGNEFYLLTKNVTLAKKSINEGIKTLPEEPKPAMAVVPKKVAAKPKKEEKGSISLVEASFISDAVDTMAESIVSEELKKHESSLKAAMELLISEIVTARMEGRDVIVTFSPVEEGDVPMIFGPEMLPNGKVVLTAVGFNPEYFGVTEAADKIVDVLIALGIKPGAEGIKLTATQEKEVGKRVAQA